MATNEKKAPVEGADFEEAAAPLPPPRARGIGRSCAKDSPTCEITFTLPGEAASDATTVCIMGEFNDWSPTTTPMVRRANGDYYVTLQLERGRAYRFRYLIDGERFENDWYADRYEPNPYGGQDSVIEV